MGIAILPDKIIRYLAEQHMMIQPFVEKRVKYEGKPTLGLSSFGYDVALGNRFLISKESEPLDVSKFEQDKWEKVYVPFGEELLVEPGRVVLGVTRERFVIPPWVVVYAADKSSLRRMGLHCSGTIAEPTWAGYFTIALTVTTSGLKVSAGWGIMQFLFYSSSFVPDTLYFEMDNDYQFQPPWPVLPGGKSLWSWDDLTKEDREEFDEWKTNATSVLDEWKEMMSTYGRDGIIDVVLAQARYQEM